MSVGAPGILSVSAPSGSGVLHASHLSSPLTIANGDAGDKTLCTLSGIVVTGGQLVRLGWTVFFKHVTSGAGIQASIEDPGMVVIVPSQPGVSTPAVHINQLANQLMTYSYSEVIMPGAGTFTWALHASQGVSAAGCTIEIATIMAEIFNP